jgi:predicted permease
MAGLLSLLFISLGLGALARRSKLFPVHTHFGLNAVVLNVALPALVLRSIHDVPFTGKLFAGAAMMWLVFLGAMGLFILFGRVMRLSSRSVGALVLTGGLCNSAFIGLPVLEAMWGREAVGIGVFVDQMGSFLVMATLGLGFAAAASGGTAHPAAIARKVLLFPPFVALILALLLRPVAYPAWFSYVLDRLGSMLTPLALFSVGFQLQLGALRERVGPLFVGLGYKLLLAPALAAAVLLLFAGPDTLVWKATVTQTAMAPMVTGGIIASQYDLDPPLAAAMLGVGIPLSAASIGALLALIG